MNSTHCKTLACVILISASFSWLFAAPQTSGKPVATIRRVAVLSGSQEDSLLRDMLKMGAVELVPKPFDLERLVLTIQVALILTGCGAPSR